MVAGLIQSENVAAVALKNSDKQAEDSGLESGHTSMNNCELFNINLSIFNALLGRVIFR